MPSRILTERAQRGAAGAETIPALTRPPPPYVVPQGVEREMACPALARGGARTGRRGGGGGRVRVRADWLLIREHGVPAAEVFYTRYEREPRDPRRPLMFLFNGGPGAASAFLHVGTAGPRRAQFTADGRVLPPPARLVDNAETWLRCADLVFVDPVGTGLSRTVAESRLEQQALHVDDDQRRRRTKALPAAKKGFYTIKRDIGVLAEFVSAMLSETRRWDSPVYIAGESYGGFRVGKLMRALPERGVGLCGAVMISPAIDFLSIIGTDYDLLSWLCAVPTMALTARVHGKVRGRFASLRPAALAEAAERFAVDDLAPVLLRGDAGAASERGRVFAALAELIGLPREIVTRCGGRVRVDTFARELLRAEGLVCGLYDGAITGHNVFPDREVGWTEPTPTPDPTLAGITSTFASAANTLLRRELGLSTWREYHLMSHEAWQTWIDDQSLGYWQRQLECADDVRWGMAATPGLKLLVCHGLYDLVTTYASSAQSVAALRLPGALRARVALRNYPGGHMFYTWEASRRGVLKDIAGVVA
ncbi:MAG: peptidase S10 [Phycisphaerales bacterium]